MGRAVLVSALVVAAIACSGSKTQHTDDDPLCVDGAASRQAFAEHMMSLLQVTDRSALLSYDAEHFRLESSPRDDSDTALRINLENVRREYCAADVIERPGVISRFARTMRRGFRSSSTAFDDVRKQLLPAVRARILFVASFRELGPSMDAVPGRAIADHLWLTLVVDSPESVQYVTRKQLDDWNVSDDDAFAIAVENLRARSGDEPEQISPGLYQWHSDEGWAAARLALTDRLQRLKLRGDPVVIPAAPNDLLIAGADDDAALSAMADRATEILGATRPITGLALRLRGGTWEAFLPPPSFASRPKIHALQLNDIATAYNQDKELLDKEHQKRGEDVFVASLMVFKGPDGDHRSVAAWTRDVPTLLPHAEWIAFMDPRGDDRAELIGLARWDDVAKVLGPALERVGDYPPRWKATRFPTAAQLSTIPFEPPR